MTRERPVRHSYEVPQPTLSCALDGALTTRLRECVSRSLWMADTLDELGSPTCGLYGMLYNVQEPRLAAIFRSSQLYWQPPATRARYSRFLFAAPQPTLYGAVNDNIKDKVRAICDGRTALPLSAALCSLQNGLYHELYARALRGAGQMLADVQHLHRAPGTLLPAAVFWSPP